MSTRTVEPAVVETTCDACGRRIVGGYDAMVYIEIRTGFGNDSGQFCAVACAEAFIALPIVRAFARIDLHGISLEPVNTAMTPTR